MYPSVPADAALRVLEVVVVLKRAVDSGHDILDSTIVEYCASLCLPTKYSVTPEGSHYSGCNVSVLPIVVGFEHFLPVQ